MFWVLWICGVVEKLEVIKQSLSILNDFLLLIVLILGEWDAKNITVHIPKPFPIRGYWDQYTQKACKTKIYPAQRKTTLRVFSMQF